MNTAFIITTQHAGGYPLYWDSDRNCWTSEWEEASRYSESCAALVVTHELHGAAVVPCDGTNPRARHVNPISADELAQRAASGEGGEY